MIPNWLDEIEEQVAMALDSRGALSARDLAESLGVSEGSAVSYIGLLASMGRLSIDRVSLPGETERGSEDAWPGTGVLSEAA